MVRCFNLLYIHILELIFARQRIWPANSSLKVTKTVQLTAGDQTVFCYFCGNSNLSPKDCVARAARISVYVIFSYAFCLVCVIVFVYVGSGRFPSLVPFGFMLDFQPTKPVKHVSHSIVMLFSHVLVCQLFHVIPLFLTWVYISPFITSQVEGWWV